MKPFAFILLAVLALTMDGCSGDSSSGPDPDDETPEVTETIGPSGGIIETMDFSLAVPAGAFASETELKIFESSEDHGLGSNCVSRLLRVEGLPEEYTDTLLVRIQYEGSVGGEMYLGHGEEVQVFYQEADPAAVTFYTLLEAQATSGYLECRLPPREAARAGHHLVSACSAAKTLADHFLALAGYGSWVESRHFFIAYPLYLIDFVDNLAAYFEAAYDSVVGVGIDYDYTEWDWPWQITIKELHPFYAGRYMSVAFHSKNSPKFEVNENKLSESNLGHFKPRAFVWMLAAAQFTTELPWSFENLDLIAWNAAVGGWFEEKGAEPSAFVRPAGFSGHEARALEGLLVGFFDKGAAENRGRGWAPVVKYLATRFGDDTVGEVYNTIKVEGKTPVEALFEHVTEPAYNWWPQFVDCYLMGEIYAVEASALLGHTAARVTIDDASDTSWAFGEFRGQVWADLYRFDLEYESMPEDAAIAFRQTSWAINPDYMSVLVYTISDGELALIAEGNPATVRDIRGHTLAGRDLLAVEVNSYNASPFDRATGTEFSARLVSHPIFDYDLCRIDLKNITAHVHRRNGTEEDYTIGLNASWSTYGTFTDSVFYGEYTETQGELTKTGNVTVTLNSLGTRVREFYATETRMQPGINHHLSVRSVEGYRLPKGAEPGVDLIFQREGVASEPCS